jgi:hypothetical protein
MDSSGRNEGLLLTETAGVWAPGVEADLPANAATTGNRASLQDISCAAPGNCVAVGSYPDSSGNVQGLLLTETSGTWAAGVEAALPADAAASNGHEAEISSVSCASVGSCSAVGSYLDSSGNTHGLLLDSPALAVTLTVSKGGGGAGIVSSSPTGITCGTTCSQNYTQGTPVALTATPAAGSTFAGWAGPCSGTGICALAVDADTTVTATFKPIPCTVPWLKGRTLGATKVMLRSHFCSVGKIRHATSRTVKKGHVISQRPKAGVLRKQGARVSLVVSKGRRR